MADRGYVMETGRLAPIDLAATTEAELMAAYLGASPTPWRDGAGAGLLLTGGVYACVCD